MDKIETIKLLIEAFVAFCSTFSGVYLSMRLEGKREKKYRIERGRNLLRYVIAELEEIHNVLARNRPLSEEKRRNYTFRSFAIDGISFEQMEAFSPILGTRLMMFREELKEIKRCIDTVRTKNHNVSEANKCKTKWYYYRTIWLEEIRITNEQIEREFPKLIPNVFFKAELE